MKPLIHLVLLSIPLLHSTASRAQIIDLSEVNQAILRHWREGSGGSFDNNGFYPDTLHKISPRKTRRDYSDLHYEEYSVYRVPVADPISSRLFFPTRDTLRQWDLLTGKEVRRFQFDPRGESRGRDWGILADSEHSRLFGTRSSTSGSGYTDGPPILVWDSRGGEEIQRFTFPSSSATYDWALSPDGRFLAHAAKRKANWEVIDTLNGKVVFRSDRSHGFPNQLQNFGVGMSFLAETRLAYISGRELCVLDIHTKRLDQTTVSTDRSERIGALATNRLKTQIATIHQSGKSDIVVIRDTKTLKEERRFQFPVGDNQFSPQRLEFSGNGKQLLVSIRGWGAVKAAILDLDTGRCIGAVPLAGATWVPGTDLIAGLYEHAHKLRLWSSVDFRPIAELVPMSAERHWAIKTWQGYFNASKLTLEILKKNNERLTVNRDVDLVRDLYRPNYVRLLLRGVPPEVVEQTPEDYEPPQVKLRLVSVSKGAATIAADATATGTDVDIASMNVQRVGRELEDATRESLNNAMRFAAGVSVAFPPGKNTMTLAATVTDTLGVKSKTATLTVERPEHVEELSGRLFVLSVGVSKHKYPEYDLKFPAVDAQALAQEFAKQEGLTFGEVHTQVYTDKKATLANLRDGLSWLERVCTPDDVAVVFFAGHGIKGRRGLYYVTHAGDAEAMQYSCLNWEEVAKTLKAVKAKQTLFLSDACYAGGFAKTQLAMQRDLAESLQTIDNLLVFASSGAEETSLEDEAWGHGAFTVSLLAALTGKADSDQDGSVSLKELVQYTTQATQELTSSAQTPFVATTGSYDASLRMARPTKQNREQPKATPVAPSAVEIEATQ